jgi:hypothetical protein
MQTQAIVNHPKKQIVAFPRAGYAMREFAALFGKEKTWAYRMVYAGEVKVNRLRGEFIVPHAEVERLQYEAAVYSDDIAGKPVPKKTQRKENPAINRAAIT